MSVLQKIRLISNERLDLPDILNVDNFVDADWMAYMEKFMCDTPCIIGGFDITSAPSLVNSSNSVVYVNIANSIMFHPTSLAVSGGFFVAPASEAAQAVTLTANATNYIEMDHTTLTGSFDTRSFWDPQANEEYSQAIDTVTYLKVVVSSNTAAFTQSKVPIAKIKVNNAGVPLITEITDCRPMFFRLGSGGTNPDSDYTFTWPNSPAGYDRIDVPVTATGPSDPNPFAGSDKNLRHFKDWMDAVMTKFKEIGGTDRWFEQAIYSLAHAAQDRNVHMLDQGVLWNWNSTTETLTWSGNVEFQVPGSTGTNVLPAGSIVLGSTGDQGAYVTISRDGVGATAATATGAAYTPIADGVFVFARRDGTDVTVGTHSFRVKDADTTESDYSDHLAKERILKPIINPDPVGSTADNYSIFIYPSQRVSGNKRRYTYIKPKESSTFPRLAYSTGIYDGGTGDLNLTKISFSNVVPTTLDVSAALPSVTPGVLASSTIGANGFTPVLIAISDVDIITVTFGTTKSTLPLAIEDGNLPIPASADYPVAVVVVEVASNVIQSITDSHLLDRRPTGAGGSGGGGGTGVVVEMVAVGGETVIDFTDGAVFPVAISYIPGTADLSVIENGVELYVGAGADYTETSTTSITLTSPAVAGDRYKFRTGAGITPGLAYGDVFGPAGSAATSLARFADGTGKLLADSGVLLDGSDCLSGIVDLTMDGVLTGGGGVAPTPFEMVSAETDGATAIGYQLNTQNALTNAAALLLSLQNNSVPKFVVDKDGNVTVVGTVDGVDVSGIPGTVSAKVAKAGDTMTGDLVMDNQKAVEFREASGGGTDSVKIKAPAALAASYVLTLPGDDGATGEFLKTDGTGTLSWADPTVGFLTASLYTAKGALLSATGPGALSALLVGANPDGYVLTLDVASPTGLKWSATGSGNVNGPPVSTDNALVVFDGVSGAAIKNSLSTLDTLGIMTMGGAVNFKRKTNADSAIELANSLKATMNAHAADGPPPGEHLLDDIANFPVLTANATSLASLLTLTFDLLTAYAAHNADAILAGSPPVPVYHLTTMADHPLVSALIPTNLDEAVARLNDLKAKYNLHDANNTGHTTGSLHQEAVADSSGDIQTSGETIVAIVDTTTARAVALSIADMASGRTIFIKDESGGATTNNITVTPASGSLDGAANVPIVVNYGCLRVYSDSQNWFSL